VPKHQAERLMWVAEVTIQSFGTSAPDGETWMVTFFGNLNSAYLMIKSLAGVSEPV